MIVFPPVKINLGLNVTARRMDGYHDIDSVFIPVAWTDALEAVISDNQEFKFSSSGLPIPGNTAGNLVCKAFRLLAEKYPLPGIHLHLHKVLPMGAGLGGGSSDGANALKLINSLCGLGIERHELEALAAQLGSDCPFFIDSTPKHVSGRGETMNAVDLQLKDWYVLIVMPPVSIGTAEAYSWIRPSVPELTVAEIIASPVANWKGKLKNDFEEGAMKRHPVIGEIKAQLYREGAVYASMSGSGAAVYGLFSSLPDLQAYSTYQVWCGRID